MATLETTPTSEFSLFLAGTCWPLKCKEILRHIQAWYWTATSGLVEINTNHYFFDGGGGGKFWNKLFAEAVNTEINSMQVKKKCLQENGDTHTKKLSAAGAAYKKMLACENFPSPPSKKEWSIPYEVLCYTAVLSVVTQCSSPQSVAWRH